jgi:ATP-dependent exoDNAse (exonuclease V) beta subunit
MGIVFKADTHSYTSTDEDIIDWISVTSLVSNFKEPFDAKAVAEKVSKNKKSKWYGLNPQEIQDIWKAEAFRATELGTFYHNQRESDICSLASIEREGTPLPVYVPLEKDGLKYAPEQKITDGIYPEMLVYLKSAGVCGQSDLVEVVNGRVMITDYKTNKEIKTESYKNWEGVSKKMLFPVHHLDDCHINHYALQLSIYMYIILKHNPKLQPGNIFIHHVVFEQQSEDKNGYPVYKILPNGDPVVTEVIPIELPYLRDEVISIMQWLKDNRDKIKKK